MNSNAADFEKKSHMGKSFICACGLCALAFSVLPVSLSADFSGKDDETPIRVYSYSEPKRESGEKPSGVRAADVVAKAPAYPTISHTTGDISHLNVSQTGTLSIPSLSDSVGDFSIGNFGAAQNSEGAGGVTIFSIDSLDAVPRLKKGAHVKYPPELLRKGVEGEVVLNVIIDESGRVIVESVAKSDDPKFESCAIEAAGSLLYETPLKNGEKVRARFALPIPFKIQK